MEEMSLENAIKELKRHKANETDHYKDFGICSEALEVAIKYLERENNKSSLEEKTEELAKKYLAQKQCNHRLVFMESDKTIERNNPINPYNVTFIRKDRFYCKKCGEIITKQKRSCTNYEDIPEWY